MRTDTMRKIEYPLSALFIVCIMAATPSYAKWVWNKETGWMDSPSTAVTTLEQRYKYALSLLVEQKYINAIKEFESIINTDPRSEYAEVSQINILAPKGQKKYWKESISLALPKWIPMRKRL